MTRHPRAMVTQQAHFDIDAAVIQAVGKYGLTYGELQGLLAQIQLSWARWQVKDERTAAEEEPTSER